MRFTPRNPLASADAEDDLAQPVLLKTLQLASTIFAQSPHGTKSSVVIGDPA